MKGRLACLRVQSAVNCPIHVFCVFFVFSTHFQSQKHVKGTYFMSFCISSVAKAYERAACLSQSAVNCPIHVFCLFFCVFYTSSVAKTCKKHVFYDRRLKLEFWKEKPLANIVKYVLWPLLGHIKHRKIRLSILSRHAEARVLRCFIRCGRAKSTYFTMFPENAVFRQHRILRTFMLFWRIIRA